MAAPTSKAALVSQALSSNRCEPGDADIFFERLSVEGGGQGVCLRHLKDCAQDNRLERLTFAQGPRIANGTDGLPATAFPIQSLEVCSKSLDAFADASPRLRWSSQGWRNGHGYWQTRSWVFHVSKDIGEHAWPIQGCHGQSHIWRAYSRRDYEGKSRMPRILR